MLAFRMLKDRLGWPLGERLICEPDQGAEATKKRGWEVMNSTWVSFREG